MVTILPPTSTLLSARERSNTSSTLPEAEEPHLRDGFPSNSRVEVYHCSENGRLYDYWLYLAVGSGIYFDLGRTVAFPNAFVMARALNVSTAATPWCRKIDRAPGFYCNSARQLAATWNLLFHKTIDVLIKRGYDSVQLTRSEEHAIFKYEILDLRRPRATRNARPNGKDAPLAHACPQGVAAAHYYRGLGGTLPCVCNESVSTGCLNCGREWPVV